MRFLGNIEIIFTIQGRGTVIVPIWHSDVKVKVGDRVHLRSSDGRIRDTKIAGVEMLKPVSEKCRAAFILARDVRKGEIAEGMEIWLPDANDTIQS
jgi:translation elongation factor EF-Tu-like GTPase